MYSAAVFARVPPEIVRQLDAIVQRRRNTLHPVTQAALIREALAQLCEREARRASTK